ncbi:MAG: PhnD/SsuA/transferrin family substrate-binding protein [Azospirillaceae bacterium]
MAGVPLAVLPMYDWPEVRDATDRLWACLRVALRAAGFAAPEALDRAIAPWDAWRSPDLLLGQTCGLPFRRHLEGQVTLLGAPDYGVEGCPPGHYRSVLVARANDRRDGLTAFAGARLALNGEGSQSGLGALVAAFAPDETGGGFFREALVTGAHRQSIVAIAEDRADIAAIDAISWRLAQAHEPAARRLRVVGLTPPTPGLPFISAAGRDQAALAGAVERGLASLDDAAARVLGIAGFARFVAADYAVIDPAVSLGDLVARPAHPEVARPEVARPEVAHPEVASPEVERPEPA